MVTRLFFNEVIKDVLDNLTKNLSIINYYNENIYYEDRIFEIIINSCVSVLIIIANILLN